MSKREWKFLCVICIWILLLGVNIVYGMELGGFGIDIGVGMGSVEEDWNGDSEVDSSIDIENDADVDQNVVQESEKVPEIEIVPEEEPIPEIEIIPDTNPIPEIEIVPDEKPGSEVEVIPEEKPKSEEEVIPEKKPVSKEAVVQKEKSVPEIIGDQEVQSVMKEKKVSKIEDVQERGRMHEIKNTDNIELSPTVSLFRDSSAEENMIGEEKEQLKVLEYYDEKADIKKQKMKCYKYEAEHMVSNQIVFEIESDDVIHILSFRINGKECNWKLEDNKLTGKNMTGKAEVYIEILYLCENEDVRIRLTEE